MAKAVSKKPTSAASQAPGLDLGILPEFIGYQMRRAQVAIFVDFIRTCAEVDLRPAQFSALLVIEANPGRKQSDIADALMIQRPNFVAMMDELERRALAERVRATDDRRAYVISLTDAGRALLTRAKALARASEQRMLTGIDAKTREALLATLVRIADPTGK